MRYENEAVNNGVELLNDYFGGTEWADRVDVDAIDQFSISNCVVAQLFGGYSEGVETLLPDVEDYDSVEVQYDHGFDWPGNTAKLDEEWKERITDLQVGPGVSTPESIQEAVDNGIHHLNEYFSGTDWVKGIDTSILNQANPRACVVGQLFDGDFATGLTVLGVEENHSDYGYSFGMYPGRYDELTSEWVERIDNMQAAYPVETPEPTTTLSLHICTTVTVDVDDTTLGRLYREAREYGVNVETLLEERFTEVAIEATHEIDV